MPTNPPPPPPHRHGLRGTSNKSLHLREVPERRSSTSILVQSIAGSRQSSMQNLPSWKLPPASAASKKIPFRGKADSPVRCAAENDPVSSDELRSSPSRTFIRTRPPLDILSQGSFRHARLDMGLRLPSPLFAGGGTIEGQVQLVVDGGADRRNKSKPIFISTLSIDVIGVEETNDGRRWIFLSLASELFDHDHPPPASLVTSQDPVEHDKLYWQLRPSTATIPFLLNLPLNLGPPPYLSRQANIRYLLCPTAVIKIGNKTSLIRQSWNIQMLTVHDPEKALASLPSPLLASDSLVLTSAGEAQNVRLTAGLHRQTWVNGAGIFVDIHVANNSTKSVKKIEVQLEKTVLWFAHAAAGTVEKSASHLRLPKKTDNEIIQSSVLKRTKEWSGISAYSSEVRTCEITVPRGHVTISTGRYFEVRYFLTVLVSVSIFKVLAVQLPVTLIHYNSLDILPNALSQVTASIEAKRARTVPAKQETPIYAPYHQGQAFTAARRQSVERNLRQTQSGNIRDDLSTLATELQESPRGFAKHLPHCHSNFSEHLLTENVPPGRSSGVPSSHHHHIRHTSCYHCQLALNEHSRNTSSIAGPAPAAAPAPGPKIPRLQLSTSGLGFSDSEFEIAPDSPPRKVMLSERERKMIIQQRDLNIQRQISKRSRRASDADAEKVKPRTSQDGSYWGWKNVAAVGPDAGPKLPEHGNQSRFRAPQQQKQQMVGIAGRRSVEFDAARNTFSGMGSGVASSISMGQGQGRPRSRSNAGPERSGTMRSGTGTISERNRTGTRPRRNTSNVDRRTRGAPSPMRR